MGHSPKHNDSSSVIPNTVGDGPSLLEISSSVPSGSLPDLTSFQFTPPLQQPIDPEDSQLTNSPYSTVCGFFRFPLLSMFTSIFYICYCTLIFPLYGMSFMCCVSESFILDILAWWLAQPASSFQ